MEQLKNGRNPSAELGRRWHGWGSLAAAKQNRVNITQLQWLQLVWIRAGINFQHISKHFQHNSFLTVCTSHLNDLRIEDMEVYNNLDNYTAHLLSKKYICFSIPSETMSSNVLPSQPGAPEKRSCKVLDWLDSQSISSEAYFSFTEMKLETPQHEQFKMTSERLGKAMSENKRRRKQTRAYSAVLWLSAQSTNDKIYFIAFTASALSYINISYDCSCFSQWF